MHSNIIYYIWLSSIFLSIQTTCIFEYVKEKKMESFDIPKFPLHDF